MRLWALHLALALGGSLFSKPPALPVVLGGVRVAPLAALALECYRPIGDLSRSWKSPMHDSLAVPTVGTTRGKWERTRCNKKSPQQIAESFPNLIVVHYKPAETTGVDPSRVQSW